MTADGRLLPRAVARRRAGAALLSAMAVALCLGGAPVASARVHWSVGIGIGVPGPYYWPYYGPYPYYGGGYYTPWASGWWPAPVYPAPPVVVQGVPWQPQIEAPAPQPLGPPPQSFWYHCAQPAGYYPQVPDCPGGWTAVPAAAAPAPAPGAPSQR